MEPGKVVRTFYERMQARDWPGAGELLAHDVHVSYTSTGERFTGERFLAMNRDYPEGWNLEVEEIIAAGSRVAAQVIVRQDGQVFRCAGFYTVADGRIADGVEHWVTEGSEPPPPWRHPYTS